MDLFSISCTTCKSRLKVREESAIGQILACPKCGGMVMVNPPAGWKKGEPLPAPAPQQSAAALPITTVVEVRRPDETLGDSNFDAVDDLLSDAPPKVRVPSSVSVAPDAPGLARPRFVGAPPPAASAAAASAAPATASPAALATSTTPTTPMAPANQNGHPPAQPVAKTIANGQPSQPQPPQTAEALKPPPPGEANLTEPPPPDWSPPRPWRYWAMMAGSVAAGIVLALAVVVGMIQFFKGKPQTVVQVGPPLTNPAATTPATNPASKTTTTPVNVPATNPVTPNPVSPSPETPVVEVVPMPAVEPMPPMPAPMPMPIPAVEQDPIGLTEPPPQPEVKPANPNDPLAKFDRLLNGDAGPAGASEPMPPAPPMAEPSPTVAEKPALPRPAPRSVNITARLADPLPGIETAGTPLADFLQFFQDLSTVPITLEPDGLSFVKATAESPVMLTTPEVSKNTTVGAALAAGLRPLGLEYAIADDQLVVRPIEPAMRRALSFPVQDLAADEAQMAELAEILQALIEPASWNVNGGEGTLIVDAMEGKLVVSQRRAVHAQLLVACEKLRTARKLPYKSNLDAGLFQLHTRLARAKARLEAPVSLNFSQPTPLVRILDRLGKAGDVRILVDWRDVATAEWNPDGEATLIADNQPLGAALDSLLGPMDLAWRVVDGQTIQVLTPETLANRNELEYHPAADLTADDATGEALIAKLRAALGPEQFRDSGGACELRYDPAGQCLLASLPQLKQRELESLLAKWRSDSGGALPAKER